MCLQRLWSVTEAEGPMPLPPHEYGLLHNMGINPHGEINKPYGVIYSLVLCNWCLLLNLSVCSPLITLHNWPGQTCLLINCNNVAASRCATMVMTPRVGVWLLSTMPNTNCSILVDDHDDTVMRNYYRLMTKPTLPLACVRKVTRQSRQQFQGHQGEMVHQWLLASSCICPAGIGTPEYQLAQIF